MWQPGISLDRVERETILTALKYFQGNRTHTAESLGISVKTVRNKLERYENEGYLITPNPPGTPAEQFEADQLAKLEKETAPRAAG